jgi:precorrin-6A/cobalt-precorrin-6A reductase
MAAKRPRILLIGGTTEARELAASIDGHVITSLAGVTSDPKLPEGRVRTGGFGGSEGLVEYIRSERIEAIVDAAHPYAARMHNQVAFAAECANIPRMTLIRPPWKQVIGDRWSSAPNAESAAISAFSLGQTILFTHGREVPPSVRAARGHTIHFRTIEKPERLPPEIIWQKARLPLDIDSEAGFIEQNRIDVIVSKQSGGRSTYAKIEAARHAGVPVIMIERPQFAFGNIVSSTAAVRAWLEDAFGRRT